MPWEYLCLCVRGLEANVRPDFALFFQDFALSSHKRFCPFFSQICTTVAAIQASTLHVVHYWHY